MTFDGNFIKISRKNNSNILLFKYSWKKSKWKLYSHPYLLRIVKWRLNGKTHYRISHLGAVVIEARRCSFVTGAKRFVLWKSQSNVFCRKPHERFMRSETSVLTISDGDVNGISTVNFGLEIENMKGKKKTKQFWKRFLPIVYLLWCAGRRWWRRL